MRVTLLSLLLPLVSGAIVSISTRALMMEPPYELDLVDLLSGQFKKIMDLGDTAPSCSGLQNDKMFVYCKPFLDGNTCFTTVDLSTGESRDGRNYSFGYFDGYHVDKQTNQTFVIAAMPYTSLYELLPDQTLRKMVDLPSTDLIYASTYSSSKHVLFLVIVNVKQPAVVNVLTVSTAGEGKILYNVSVPLFISTFVYDDTFGVLYAWARPAMLVSLDYTTGKILKTFFHSSTLQDGGECTVNSEGTVVYGSLIDTPNNRPVIVAVELNTGNATIVPTERFARAMDFFQ